MITTIKMYNNWKWIGGVSAGTGQLRVFCGTTFLPSFRETNNFFYVFENRTIPTVDCCRRDGSKVIFSTGSCTIKRFRIASVFKKRIRAPTCPCADAFNIYVARLCRFAEVRSWTKNQKPASCRINIFTERVYNTTSQLYILRKPKEPRHNDRLSFHNIDCSYWNDTTVTV